MNIVDLKNGLDPLAVGQEMYSLVSELYPICRSITGNGFRETLWRVEQHAPLTIHEVPSGTTVFDWTVPREWNISDAYVKNMQGERVIDFKMSTLHVVSYSTPIKRVMPLQELKGHLFTLPEFPNWIPYRTSYYNDNWGFCLSHKQLLELEDGMYDVCIDSSLEPGYLTYGEYLLEGETQDEVLISCHACHPALCNDNLSGVALATFLAKHLGALPLRYSYRFLFIPGTIGAITWLCLNEAHVARIKAGLVVTCVGDSGHLTYKRSRRGDTTIDRAVAHVLKHRAGTDEIIDFTPDGYDERQYCSPAFNLPVGCLMRTPHGQFPQYHTSADNLDFVQPAYLADSFFTCLSILHVLEMNKTYMNMNPHCEPQLGKRGLYRAIGGAQTADIEMARLWILNLSDGDHSLLDIAERSGLESCLVEQAADGLVQHGLLQERRSD